jgi:predicted dehydrogenase
MVAQYQRFVPIYRGVKRLLDAGEIGDVRAVRLDSMQNLLDPQLSAYYPAGHWLFDGSRAGGGVVISLTVHKLDLLRYFVGDVARVTALCRTLEPAFVNGAEDYAVALLEFQNGAVGELFSTYSGYRLPWGEHFTIFGADGTVYGITPQPKGQALAMVASSRRLAQVPEPGHDPSDDFTAVSPSDDLPTEQPFLNQILHFADCCRTGAEPISSGRDNLGTMKAIFAIYESSRTGKPVELGAL